MKRNLILSAGLLGLLVFATQSFSADSKPASPSVTLEVMNGWQRRIPEFNADGLNLFDVAAELRRQFPEVNFIVPANGDPPEFRVVLRSVTLSDILKAIELASNGRIRPTIAGAGQTVDPATGLPVPVGPSEVRSNLVSFSYDGLVDVPAPPQNPATCRVFSLSPYLAGLSEKETDEAVKSLHEAFEISLEMLKRQDREVKTPDFTIHHGTKLLIAVGREKELAVIEQVIKELQGSAPSRSLPASDKPAPKAKAPAGALPTGTK